MSTATKERPAKRKARELDGRNEWRDHYGVDARTGHNVVTVAEPVVRSDGVITLDRLRELAGKVGRGFVISPTRGWELRAGYAVSVHPDRDRMLDRVKPLDLLEYIRDNKDVLLPCRKDGDTVLKSSAVLSVRRVPHPEDPSKRVVLMTVCTVVHNYQRAKLVAGIQGRGEFVDLANGRVVRA